VVGEDERERERAYRPSEALEVAKEREEGGNQRVYGEISASHKNPKRQVLEFQRAPGNAEAGVHVLVHWTSKYLQKTKDDKKGHS